MNAKDHVEHSDYKNNLCRLEWIAWAIDAARRYKKLEQRAQAALPRRDWAIARIDSARR